MMPEITVGCVARCSRGIKGVVTGKGIARYDGKTEVWNGISFAGQEWCSRQPEYLASNINEYAALFDKEKAATQPQNIEVATLKVGASTGRVVC
jgi:hypothetical protein